MNVRHDLAKRTLGITTSNKSVSILKNTSVGVHLCIFSFRHNSFQVISNSSEQWIDALPGQCRLNSPAATQCLVPLVALSGFSASTREARHADTTIAESSLRIGCLWLRRWDFLARRTIKILFLVFGNKEQPPCIPFIIIDPHLK